MEPSSVEKILEVDSHIGTHVFRCAINVRNSIGVSVCVCVCVLHVCIQCLELCVCVLNVRNSIGASMYVCVRNLACMFARKRRMVLLCMCACLLGD